MFNNNIDKKIKYHSCNPEVLTPISQVADAAVGGGVEEEEENKRWRRWNYNHRWSSSKFPLFLQLFSFHFSQFHCLRNQAKEILKKMEDHHNSRIGLIWPNLTLSWRVLSSHLRPSWAMLLWMINCHKKMKHHKLNNKCHHSCICIREAWNY